ncbi:MAG: ABC transporter substrate-binding protein [Candidatus Sulfotelmatobacter sp.]
MTNDSPRRIASLQPSATVILAAIGEFGRVVACSKYCADVVPEIVSRRCVILSDSWTANSEQIIPANPDLVVGSVPYQDEYLNTPGSHASPRPAGARICDSSRSICATGRNPPNYRHFTF